MELQKRLIKNLHKLKAQRPEGYVEEVLGLAEEVNHQEGWYRISDENFKRLQEKYAAYRAGIAEGNVKRSRGISSSRPKNKRGCGCSKAKRR